VARELANNQARSGVVYATPVVVGTFFPAFLPVAPPAEGPAEPAPPARDRFGQVINPFDPPLRQILLERDFGGGLGSGLPGGWAGAPGRLHHDLDP